MDLKINDEFEKGQILYLQDMLLNKLTELALHTKLMRDQLDIMEAEMKDICNELRNLKRKPNEINTELLS